MELENGFSSEHNTSDIANRQNGTVRDTEVKPTDQDAGRAVFLSDDTGSPPKKKPLVRVHFPPDEQLNEFFSVPVDNRNVQNGNTHSDEPPQWQTTIDENLPEAHCETFTFVTFDFTNTLFDSL